MLILFILQAQATLFAGNGIITYLYTINQEFEMGCNTYNECFTLLCYFLTDPSLMLKLIQPNPWDGDCNQLPMDNRTLNADLIINNNTITINNMSQASFLLCQQGLIEYVGPIYC